MFAVQLKVGFEITLIALSTEVVAAHCKVFQAAIYGSCSRERHVGVFSWVGNFFDWCRGQGNLLMQLSLEHFLSGILLAQRTVIVR